MSSTARMPLITDQEVVRIGGSTMKRMHSGAGKKTFGLCVLMATLLLGPAVAKADPVLDWNAIAVDTAVADGQNPFAQARFAAIVQLAIAVLALYVSQRRRAVWPCAAAFALAVIASSYLAARHPADYYADAYAVNGKPAQVFAWIARTQPSAIGGWGLRVGTVDVLDPFARTIDLPESHACAAARAAGVRLVAVAESDRSPWLNEQRLRAARLCGRVTFDDGAAVISGFSL